VRRVGVLAVVLALAGCGSDAAGPEAGRAAAKPADPCHRPATTVAGPEGLVVPEGTLFGSVRDAPPNRKAEGFVALTPARFVTYMERRADVGILFRESEGADAEVMVTDGRQRSFWKLVKACPDGSRFSVLTGRELAPAAARKAIRRK
jgi:hypothetical protein